MVKSLRQFRPLRRSLMARTRTHGRPKPSMDAVTASITPSRRIALATRDFDGFGIRSIRPICQRADMSGRFISSLERTRSISRNLSNDGLH